ncbi:MAG TPA: hypothetical protein VFA77_12540 [Candidatus Eisenbacteria bacterium]|nr:hypothetical protein [Candidatus Eisenbacteria bacterium]
MKTKTRPPIQVQLALLLGIFLECSSALSADTLDYQNKIKTRATNWQAQFGPVDFTPKDRWSWMISVHPQPLNSFKAFDREILSSGITGDHQAWIRRIFKGAFLNALTNLGPAKYYVNEGRTECSLLYYELEFDGNRVFIQESYQAFFMTVRPHDFDAMKGIGREVVGRVLFEWVNLNKRRPPTPGTIGVTDEEDPFTIPYASRTELLDSFNLPPEAKVGDTFSNRTNAPENITFHLKYWPDYVPGFVGTNGISLILFETYDGGPRMGRIYDFNWLNKGLFQADAKTLVDPPKNERSNDPYNSGPTIR